MSNTRFEVWRRQTGDSLYEWMVWDTGAMNAAWFRTEAEAYEFVQQMRQEGHENPQDAEAAK